MKLNRRFQGIFIHLRNFDRILLLFAAFLFSFSFDEFCSEVSSGRLSWSPVHTNQKFWRDNCHRFVEKEYKMLNNIIQTD